MLLKLSGWMRLALTAGLALTSLASSAADPVKIGLLEDASGNFALATIPKIHATELAVDEINAKGGILGRPVQLIAYDTQSDNTKFQELARRISEQYRIQCEFECRQPVLLHDAQSSTQLYRIAQEAVTNAIRHASPRCLNISLETNAQETVLEVTDDGSGLPAALPGNGLGLRIMAYRAAMIGATFQIERLPEAGTRVSVRLPKNSREMNPQRG